MTWNNDMSAAPRDGTVLVYMPEEGCRPIEVAQLKDGKPFVIGGVFAFDRKPVTHWMPLPTPPQEPDNAE